MRLSADPRSILGTLAVVVTIALSSPGVRAVRADERVLQGSSTRSLVLMLPALQALAALRGRDYVDSRDIETLVPRVLGHRIELAPGVADLREVLADAMVRPMETLARSTMRRR